MAKKNDKSDKIDALIAEAMAAKAKRAPGEKPPKQAKVKAEKQPDPDKEAAKAQRETEREAAKAKRDAEREAKKGERAQAREAKKTEREAKRAEKLAARQPAHLAKLEKARARLPKLTENGENVILAAQGQYSGGVALTAAESMAVAEHLIFEARSQQTHAALGLKLEEGSTVRVTTGKFAGKTGTVEKASRIRCHVRIPGVDKIAYLFTSDVEVFEPETVETDEESSDVEVIVATA